MITVDIPVAISIFLSIPLGIVFVLWIFYTNNKGQVVDSEKEELLQCPYCTHVFYYFHQDKIQMCPRCQSYIS